MIMEQIKKYIRGNKERGHEVIAELEKLGGVNQFKLEGNEEDKIYYIVTGMYNPVYCIDFESEKTLTGQLILTHPEWEEIKLPEQNKFDISTLVPFESKVLVRNNESALWYPAIWGLYEDARVFPFIVDGGGPFRYCIPYEGNKHLLGTTNDCDEYYKTWEE